MASANLTSTALDQKKRALEALERRFAVAKERQQNQINKKRGLKEEEKDEGMLDSTEEASLDLPKTDTRSKKGNFAFFGNTPRQGSHKASDEQAQDPAYRKLSESINENLVRPLVQPSSRGVSSVNKILHDLLQNGDFSHKYMQGSRGMKVDNWFLLDNFVPSRVSSLNARAKVLQSHSKRSKKHMSMKQHRKHGSFVLPQEFHKFDLFKPIHEMWKEYIVKLLKESGRNQIPQRILTADLHGSILLVVECKTAEFTGINGIMVRETTETFGIISEDNKFRVVPKKGSVFIFQAGYWKITLHGDKLSMRDISS